MAWTTKVLLFAVVGMFLFIFPMGAFLSGVWIPNDPSPAEYPIRGIDVSRHQGEVNWKRVADSGISFVYLKATEGGDFRDANFAKNLQGAREAGLACGAYHFFSLKTPGNAQAQNFIKAVPKELMALPPAIDLEYGGNAAERPAPADFRRELDSYIAAVTQEYGRAPVVYTSDDFAAAYLKGENLPNRWVRAVLFQPWKGEPWMFWQFTERAHVAGIGGFVDMDVFQGDEAAFQKLTARP